MRSPVAFAAEERFFNATNKEKDLQLREEGRLLTFFHLPASSRIFIT